MTHTPDENSTFTTHLNLEKAPNGSFEDTWDALINDNLDLIDAGVLASEGKANIILATQTAGEDLGQYAVVYLDGGAWYLASDATKFFVDPGYLLGITLDAIDEAATGRVQIFGEVTNSAWSWTAGAFLYLDYSCGLSETVIEGIPTSTSVRPYSVRVAEAITATTIRVNPLPLVTSQTVGAAVPLSADTILTGGHGRLVLVDTTAEDIAITLPAAASSVGQTFILKKSAPSATTYGCQFVATSGESIDGAASTALITTQYGTVRIISDGSDWWTV